MHNEKLLRLIQIDAQIKKIDKHLERGEHVAAGLTIELSVGADDEDAEQLQITWFTQELLELLKKSLERSREQYRLWVYNEFQELQTYLKEK